MAADLDNVALLRRMLKVTAPSQDVDALVTELRDRVLEELDYRREAENQRLFAAYYAGHPTIRVPVIVGELSARRVVTSELSTGARFAELAGWSQAERDLAGETIYRFVFRSLYEAHAFNGDPHPGNYLFHGDGRVTFLDYGLVKRFSDVELGPLIHMVRNLCVDNDPEAFRRAMEEAGFLVRGAPLSTEVIVDHMAVFYQLVRESAPLTVTPDYASAVVRRFFDLRSPVAAYVAIPRSYVILQRINLGLFALLGELNATANWREIAEEIWPFIRAPASTPIGEAEAAWRANRAPTGSLAKRASGDASPCATSGPGPGGHGNGRRVSAPPPSGRRPSSASALRRSCRAGRETRRRARPRRAAHRSWRRCRCRTSGPTARRC
jgi:hypothetical protein